MSVRDDDFGGFTVGPSTPEAQTIYVTRVTNDYGDWEGVYINGRLIGQHHHVQLQDVVRALGFDYHHFEVKQDWLEGNVELPADLADIPKEARV